MQFGDYRVELVPDTSFGLMVAQCLELCRAIWAKVCPPDDENRIRMNRIVCSSIPAPSGY